jgi:hypothetical protein
MNSLRSDIFATPRALAIGVTAVGLACFALIAPLLSYYETTGQRLQDRQEVIRRYQDAAKDLPRLRQAATDARELTLGGALLLTGSSDAIAAAALQSALKELIENQGSTSTSAEMLAPDATGDVVHRVGVRMAFAASLESLTALLAQIETARPILFVANLDIHAQGEPEDQDGDQSLAVVIDVYGLTSGSRGPL